MDRFGQPVAWLCSRCRRRRSGLHPTRGRPSPGKMRPCPAASKTTPCWGTARPWPWSTAAARSTGSAGRASIPRRCSAPCWATTTTASGASHRWTAARPPRASIATTRCCWRRASTAARAASRSSTRCRWAPGCATWCGWCAVCAGGCACAASWRSASAMARPSPGSRTRAACCAPWRARTGWCCVARCRTRARTSAATPTSRSAPARRWPSCSPIRSRTRTSRRRWTRSGHCRRPPRTGAAGCRAARWAGPGSRWCTARCSR